MAFSDSAKVIAKNLTKKFADFIAVKGVDFSVHKGECFGLLGPNGAGKTSIVKMIYGFSPISSGELLVLGENIMSDARKIKTKIGVVAQEDNLDPELTVRDNLVVYAGYFRLDKKIAERRADEVLEFMSLQEKAGDVVEHLSGGLKRRLTIGRALINEPELLILDEPTTGLDPFARHLVWQRLRKLKENGTTMILTTHYLEEASQLCDRLIILHRGQILERGTPGELIGRHVGQTAIELGVRPDWQDIICPLEETLCKARHALEDHLVLFTDDGTKLAELIEKRVKEYGIALNYQRVRPTNLEDVFLKLTGETLVSERSGEDYREGD